MTVWLCPIKNKSWRIIKNHNLYGLSESRKDELDVLQIGDLLIIYVFLPVGNIVGVCKVVSTPFFDFEPYWGKPYSGGIKYPYRIKVELIHNLIDGYKRIIPLYKLVGYYNEETGMSVEPHLRNILFYKISVSEYENILNEIKSIIE